MANARLSQEGEQQMNRRTEAWDWMRKAMDAPELAHVVRNQRRNPSPEARKLKDPVPYSALGLELLYHEAYDLLTNLSGAGRSTPVPISPSQNQQ